jgi:hypothetical protein
MRTARATIVAALIAFVAVACAESTAPAGSEDVLAGLVSATPQDSAGNNTPPPPGGAGTGYFRGYVRGPNTPGTGADTLATSPRIAGVVVRAYPITSYGTSGPNLGAPAGEVTTDENGAFTFPSIPGGEYAVTFHPPAASGYQGIYVTGPIHPTSHEHPWWVTLPRS